MKKIVTLIITLFGMISTIQACRYNVRDIGFVDLNNSNYKFYVALSSDDSAQHEQWQTLLNDRFYETNVTAEIISQDSQIFKDNPPKQLPSVLLVSPYGQKLVLPLSDPDKTTLQQVSDIADGLINSPIKTDIIGQIVNHYATVLLVQGNDQRLNESAAMIIENSISHIKQQMDFMPKKIKSPPILIKMSAKQAIQEKIFLWELGIDTKAGPSAVILYGRLRKMGPAMFAHKLTEDNLNAYLAVIGADCECDLDRRLLHTPMLAHHWPRQMYEDSAKILGFDPENPEVKIEISQIIASHSTVNEGELPLPDVTFGYQEFAIEENTADVSIEELPDTKIKTLEQATPKIKTTPKQPAPKPVTITPDNKIPLYITLSVAVAVILVGLIILVKK